MKYLKQVGDQLRRQNESLRKKMDRLKLKFSKRANVEAKSPKTPKSKSDHEMRKAGIDPNNHPGIRKKLIFTNCIVNEMRKVEARSTHSRVIK